MITIEKLYAETNSGLQIILYYYPQAEACVGEPKKKFKARSEKTPSAVLMPPDAKHNFYRVCDFGDEGHALSPIDIAMKEESMMNNQFYELVLKLAARHNVTDELNRSINKPRIEVRNALPTEKDGDVQFKLLKTIPDEHLKVFGPKVTHEHTDFLHWHEAEYIIYIREGKVTKKYSTENYPIFMRECVPDKGDKFYKIYEPFNPEKKFRFNYAPAGAKPGKFIHGWRELLYQIELENAMQEPAEEGEPKKPEIKTIPEAFICSGERDAICCLSMGGHPIWFNSETYSLQPSEYEMIKEKVGTLYNIPDVDSTGYRKGSELALRYMDIRTIWLPEWLKTYKDNRGNPRKDLRDWMELRQTRNEFNNLKNTAMQARFWDFITNQKSGSIEITISSVRLYYFLQLHGFRTLRDEDSDSPRYVRIEGNIVTSVRARDVRKFVREWAEQSFQPERIRNLIANTMKFSESALENLKEVELNFTNYTPTSQTMFFKNTVIEISDSGVKEYRKKDEQSNCYVWRENVVMHNVKLMEPQFKIEPKDDGFDINILDCKSSPFFGYLINSSRLYWRKEMETRFLLNGMTDDVKQAMRDYKFFHPFCIDGDGLSEKEIAEQKLCLLNKIFVIGYLLHHYKMPSRPWAPIAMDYKIGEQGECNGRSGKSFLFRTLALFCKTVTLSGRNPKLMENPHVFDQVSKHTDFIIVDDCAQYLPMNLFYDLISSDMTVNPKNNRSFTIPFNLSPKFAFSTNYVPSDFDSSSVARSLYVVFSDYYHEQSSQNDYLETRKISDDFGFDLYSESYTEDQWNADINILIQCEQFYLSLINQSIKIQPPMENIMHRKKLQDMGDNFQEWAEQYFAIDGDNLNKFIVRRHAFENFRIYSNTQKIAMKAFTRKLIAFCDLSPYIKELNPERLQNSQKRIMQTVNGIKEEMIYIETYPQEAQPEEKDPQMNFLDEMDDDDEEPD